MKTTPRSWRIPILIALTILFTIPLWQLGDDESTKRFTYRKPPRNHLQSISNTLYKEGKNTPVHAQYNFRDDPCRDFPDTDGILLVMKTGATEAMAKVPIHLLTTMSCLSDFLIFSDKEQQIGQHHIYNVLSNINPIIKSSRPEFDIYDIQSNCPTSQQDCTAGIPGAWQLDKYKFLNMVERAWYMRPRMKWYVFAEADSYIIWSNLIPWLRDKAPRGELYVGSVALVNDRPFAHGGSGYVLSGSMVEKIMREVPDVGAVYDEIAEEECCGDYLISMAVGQVGGKVKQAHPMFNGEKPSTIPYGPGAVPGLAQWCEPIFTLHHLNSEEVAQVWQYEQTRVDKGRTILIRDLYEVFMAPHLVSRREDWDNGSEDVCYIGAGRGAHERASKSERAKRKKESDKKSVVEREAHESAESCARVCEAWGLEIDGEEYGRLGTDVEKGVYVRERYEGMREDETFRRGRRCFQWRYGNGVCCTSGSFKLGRPRWEDVDDDDEEEEEEDWEDEKGGRGGWTSGWFVSGINDWIDSAGQCEKVVWIEPY